MNSNNDKSQILGKSSKISEETIEETVNRNKFIPTKILCGSLLKTKRKIDYLMDLSDISAYNLEEGTLVVTLYDLTNVENSKERSLILLIGEKRYMYITEDYEGDFTVLKKGTTEMVFHDKVEFEKENLVL